jgi:uncharacterized protein RhaS with RHS repeats
MTETGLNYNWHRDYDPFTGKYIEADLIGLAGGSYSQYTFAKSAPIAFSDPTGLITLPDITKLFDWLNPKPMSAAECQNLRDDIYRKYQLLQDELNAYNPILDGQGGFPMPYGSGSTKPGGHYHEITDLQRGLKQDLQRYNQRCRCDKDDGGNPPIPRSADAPANTPVPPPVYPFAPLPMFSPGLAPVTSSWPAFAFP